MRKHRIAIQEDLFESSTVKRLRSRVRELDALIAQAVKTDNYDRAKGLAEEQKNLLQELVALGEDGTSE